MLADIVRIIMVFDPNTGGFLTNCFTINDAISNILRSITESRSVAHLSCRTDKRDDRSYRDGHLTMKDNFRSTQ